MKKNNTIYIISILMLMFSCASDGGDNTISQSDELISESTLLSIYIENRVVETGAVIGCAASARESNDILAFYYNEEGSTDVRFYETESVNVANDDFSNYTRIDLESEPFMNGTLGMFTRTSEQERWIVMTFELDGEVKISNPIRTKQNIKPTVYTEEVTVDQKDSTMPEFNWTDDPFGENAIYFELVSDIENNVLSGTYTFDNHFKYYDISNVVLNITKGTPPQLTIGTEYNFTLMDVSEDSWVNFLTLNQRFIAQ